MRKPVDNVILSLGLPLLLLGLTSWIACRVLMWIESTAPSLAGGIRLLYHTVGF
ncbi:MAG TPA: hypothetical protein VEQ40_02130 [Pyrinomonadaceae bacterium]|nr:hypothetical protein [Pyrinomonadaceae bacterium]